MNEIFFQGPKIALRVTYRLLAALLVATLWAVAPAGAVAPPDGVPVAVAANPPYAPAFDLNDPERIEAGRKRFNRTCAGYCHGFEGTGGRAPSFKGRTDLAPQSAFETIRNGRVGAGVMPPWGGALTEEQIWELVAYLGHLGRQPSE